MITNISFNHKSVDKPVSRVIASSAVSNRQRGGNLNEGIRGDYWGGDANRYLRGHVGAPSASSL